MLTSSSQQKKDWLFPRSNWDSIPNPKSFKIYRRLAYLNMSLCHPIPSHLYLRILAFLSHPCNHHNPTSTSIRNASKAFGSEDFATMLLIFLWFCAEEYFSFNFFCTSIRWKLSVMKVLSWEIYKAANKFGNFGLPEHFLWILARNPWISRTKRSDPCTIYLFLQCFLGLVFKKVDLSIFNPFCCTWINNSLSTANFSNFTSSFSAT